MPIYLIGEGERSGPPFNREFFQEALNQIVPPNPTGGYQLKLFLIDGSTLNVCHFSGFSNQLFSVSCFPDEHHECETQTLHTDGEKPGCCRHGSCDMTMEIVPYAAIYRLQLLPRHEPGTIGFHTERARRLPDLNRPARATS